MKNRSKFVSALAVVAFAATLGVSGQAEAQDAMTKFKRGLGSTVFGVLEVPGTIVEEAKASNPVQGLIVGLVKGTYRFARREVVGVYEILTAPIAIPDGYEKIVEPEHPWQYFE